MRARSRIVVRLAQKERQGQTYWLLRWSGPGLEPDETESRERALAVGFVTKREAETRRRAVEAEVNAAFRGLLVSSSSSRAAPSVSRALDDYIVHIATQRGESDYTRAEARNLSNGARNLSAAPGRVSAAPPCLAVRARCLAGSRPCAPMRCKTPPMRCTRSDLRCASGPRWDEKTY